MAIIIITEKMEPTQSSGIWGQTFTLKFKAKSDTPAAKADVIYTIAEKSEAWFKEKDVLKKTVKKEDIVLETNEKTFSIDVKLVQGSGTRTTMALIRAKVIPKSGGNSPTTPCTIQIT